MIKRLRWHVLTCRFKLFRRVLVTNYYNRINVIDTSTVNTNALPPLAKVLKPNRRQEVEQNIVICRGRADQLFAKA
jgi:hypothetical protein